MAPLNTTTIEKMKVSFLRRLGSILDNIWCFFR